MMRFWGLCIAALLVGLWPSADGAAQQAPAARVQRAAPPPQPPQEAAPCAYTGADTDAIRCELAVIREERALAQQRLEKAYTGGNLTGSNLQRTQAALEAANATIAAGEAQKATLIEWLKAAQGH